jgi:hypothetical protein
MKSKIILIGLALLLLPMAHAQLEKPNWSTGDFWEYGGVYSGSASMDLGNESGPLKTSIDASVTMKMEIKDVEIKDIDGDYVGCYVVGINGDLSGDYLYEFGEQRLEGSFDIDAYGNLYFTTQELAVVESNIITNISITPSVPGVLPPSLNTLTTYNPPLDFMEFPVSVDERWTASSTLTTSVGGQTNSDPIAFSFECTDKIPEQGGFRYIIQADYVPFIGDLIPLNNTLIFWSESTGMIDEIKDRGGEQQSIHLSLVDSHYEGTENSPPTASFSFSPASVSEGSVVTFDGSSSSDDEGLSLLFWDFGDNKNLTGTTVQHAYGKEGTYTVTLTAMDSYGVTATASMDITVEGTGGGGGTPGFEALAIIIVIALLTLLRKKK